MTDEEIEKYALLQVIIQFTKLQDARMEIGLNNFLSEIEKRIQDLSYKIK